MKIKHLGLALGLLTGLSLIGSPAIARQACETDIQKYCGAEKGYRSVGHCLRQNADQLSPACLQDLDQRKAANQLRRKERREKNKLACSADVQNFCSHVEKGRGKVMACLKEHEAQLSEACKNRINFWSLRREARDSCKEDRDKLCKEEMTQGRKAVRACLRANQDKLSPKCQAAMNRMKNLRGLLRQIRPQPPASELSQTTQSPWQAMQRSIL